MKRIFLLAVSGCFWFGVLAVPTVHAEGLSQEQGDAILQELRQIRVLLQRGQNQPQARQPGKVAAPVRVKISTIQGVSHGSPKAPLVLVEFTDYQCPYCKRFYDGTFAELKKKYIDTGKLRFISRNLPLPFHKNAENAALAAACAGDQGKYWKMRDTLFTHSTELQEEKLHVYASQLGLKKRQFEQCLSSKKHLKKIRKDMADARSIGITGTPSFVLAKNSGKIVEGEKIIGAQPIAAFDTKIQALLKDSK